jgi:hypothetical protein
MNLNANPTIEQLRELVRQCDDAGGHHVLWVRKTGEVVISRIPDDQPLGEFEQAHPDMQLRFETFLAGNEYVGSDAAADDEWISELFERLREAWHEAKGKPDVAYADRF